MAKHLTDQDIVNIVQEIDTWNPDVKLTWEKLRTVIKNKLDVEATRQTLQTFSRLKDALNNKKMLLKDGGNQVKQPASLKIAANKIYKLEEENRRLIREQESLLAQFQVWQYNAYAIGVSLDELNKPI